MAHAAAPLGHPPSAAPSHDLKIQAPSTGDVDSDHSSTTPSRSSKNHIVKKPPGGRAIALARENARKRQPRTTNRVA